MQWTVRPGRPEDHPAYARLFLELEVDEPPPSGAVWDSEFVQLSLFAEGPEGVGAYAVAEPMGDLGYVGQLVVAPSARGQGMGRLLMTHVAERLRAQGCARWALNVKRDNAPALALYTSLGMRLKREAATLRVTRAQVAALPGPSPQLFVVPVTLEGCGALTEAFGMMPGKLARYAARGSHRLLGLVDSRAPSQGWLGMMDLRATGPVLFPFFATAPAHARALLEDAFQRVGDDVPAMNVVVTDDAALARLLRDAGAETRYETLELRGPLPAAAPAPRR